MSNTPLNSNENLRALAKKYRHIRSDIQPFINQLKRGQIIGNQVKGVRYPVYKARARNSNIQKGKSAGYRIIYWIKTPQNIILVTIYSKLDQTDISPQQIRRVIKQAGPSETSFKTNQTTPIKH